MSAIKNQGNGRGQGGTGSQKIDAEKRAAKLARMKCFNCGEKGHPAKECPHKDQQDGSEDAPLSGLTLDLVCSTAGGSEGSRIHEFYDVCLDNGSQVNIVDLRLLNNLCTSSKGFRGMSGRAHTNRVGHLEGFFECQACDTCPTNMLSMANIEDLYPVTYI